MILPMKTTLSLLAGALLLSTKAKSYRGAVLGLRKAPKPVEGKRYQLYDLSSDPEALVDVAAQHPERVRELAQLLEDPQAEWGGDRETWSADSGAPGDHLKALGYGGGDDG